MPQPITYDSAHSSNSALFELAEVIRFRYFLWHLVSRDLKVRYKRSILGIAWAMLNPLLTMATLTIVFSAVFRFSVNDYAVYVLSGLLLWNFFSQSTSVGMTSIIHNVSILSKVYVPPSVFVVAAIGSAFVHVLYALVPLIIIVVVTGVPVSLTWFFALIPVIQIALYSLGISLALATLAVFFRDIIDIYQVVLNAYFYLSPVLYPADILPEFIQPIQRLNPMFYILNNMRMPLLEGNLPSVETIMIGFAAPLLALLIGWVIFSRGKHEFPYRL